jgi:hypothetical protein
MIEGGFVQIGFTVHGGIDVVTAAMDDPRLAPSKYGSNATTPLKRVRM